MVEEFAPYRNLWLFFVEWSLRSGEVMQSRLPWDTRSVLGTADSGTAAAVLTDLKTSDEVGCRDSSAKHTFAPVAVHRWNSECTLAEVSLRPAVLHAVHRPSFERLVGS